MTGIDDLHQRLARVQDRIAAAEQAAGRSPGSVRLLLAAKTVDIATVRDAVHAAAASGGPPPLVGENRVQELVAKAPGLTGLTGGLHLIGPLQSNKVNAALRWAACVQSVASESLAERLHRRCEQDERTLEVLVQVNVSGEPTKHGVHPDRAVELAFAVAGHDRLRLRGLMTVGANSPDEARVRAGYAVLRDLRDRVVDSGEPGTATATELSMGMSRDLEAAVAEVATIVRVGSAVFGARYVPAQDVR